MDINYFKNIGIDLLEKTPAYEAFQKSIRELENYQSALCALHENIDGSKTQTLRIGTILIRAIVARIVYGKNPKDFYVEDWKSIADEVIEEGILMEGDEYSLLVFNMFAGYIDISVMINEKIDKESAGSISALSDELRSLGKMFVAGEINEADYVDRCMWVSLEAIVKLLAAYMTYGLSEEYALFIRSASEYAIQFARAKMYARENALLEEYIDNQHQLDEELKLKYEKYMADLQKEAEIFNALIENAFSADFRNMLMSSVELAKEAGVKDNEILDSISKIDEFFS